MAAMTLGSPQAPKVGVFGERNMRWYLGGQLVSLTGSMLQAAVLSLLIIKLTGKVDAAYWVGVVAALNLLPGVFLGPFAGILLDRFCKKRILIATGLLGTAQSAVLALLTYANRITVHEVIGLAALMGIVNAIDGPGRNVIVKDAVLHEHNVRPASKWFTSLYNLAQVAGPGFAGYLVLYCGYPFTFLLNSLSFVVLIVALVKMKLVPKAIRTASAKLEEAGTWNLVLSGARYTFHDAGITICILLTFAVSACGFSYYAILAVIARDMFGRNPIVYSHLAAASGIGTFVGSLTVIKFDERFPHKLFVLIGTTLLGASLFVLARTSDVRLAIALLFIAGFGVMLSFSTLRSSTIHLAKGELAGIVMGFTFTFFYGGVVLGSFGGGYIANRWGCPLELSLCGICLGVISLAIPFLPGINVLDGKAH